MKKLLLIVVLMIGAGALALFLLSKPAKLQLAHPVSVIGKQTPVQVRVANPHGVRRLTVWIEQNGTRHKMFESVQPSTRFWFLTKNEKPRTVSFTAGKKRAPDLQEGKARLLIEAQSNDFRGSTASLAQDVVVNTRPPKLSVDSEQHYINQGGSELVTFTASGYWTEAGVRVGNHTFRSFPLPGKSDANQRFSLFAFPWNMPPDTVPVVYARNPAGEEVTAHFSYKLFPKNFRTRDLQLSDSFLEKVVNQIDRSGGGDLLSRFLKINGEMRHHDNQALADLRLKTEEKMLWSGPFLQLGNSQVESQFADSRNYIYKGKKVDHQTHLGFDLAVTQHVPIVASNSGKVVWADNLGIYGNCVVIDHGYGLQSIYGHLSQISVKPGDTVRRGQVIGNSGSTGLAGGDHLHYSMQVDGVQVNPIEWWDQHWIQDRILSKLSPTMSSSPSGN